MFNAYKQFENVMNFLDGAHYNLYSLGVLTLAIHHHTQSSQQFELNRRHVGAQQRPDPLNHSIFQHAHFIRPYNSMKKSVSLSPWSDLRVSEIRLIRLRRVQVANQLISLSSN